MWTELIFAVVLVAVVGMQSWVFVRTCRRRDAASAEMLGELVGPVIEAARNANKQAVEWSKRALSVSGHELRRVEQSNEFLLSMRRAEANVHIRPSASPEIMGMSPFDDSNPDGLPPDVEIPERPHADLVGG